MAAARKGRGCLREISIDARIASIISAPVRVGRALLLMSDPKPSDTRAKETGMLIGERNHHRSRGGKGVVVAVSAVMKMASCAVALSGDFLETLVLIALLQIKCLYQHGEARQMMLSPSS